MVPLMISRSSTPKLKTSDLTEQTPSEAYSGAMYPLDDNIYNTITEVNINGELEIF